MAEESDLEKTESASPRKIEKAREAGDIPRSRELATFSILAAATSGFWLVGEGIIRELKKLLSSAMQLNHSSNIDQSFDPQSLIQSFSTQMMELGITFSPFFGLLILTAIITPMLIGGWSFTIGNVAPNFGKLDPISGFARLLSINSLIELIKAILKVILIIMGAWLMVKTHLMDVMSLIGQPIKSGSTNQSHMVLITFSVLVATLAFITIIDVPYQLWHYANKLKMTRQELKDEAKESEGNPEIKAKIRQQQREMARRRMMSKVPTADVIVTNPTHYAVALQYPENSQRAPIVVAKGVDEVAQVIRELAQEHKIMIMSAPPLARALYQHTELDDEIPPSLYTAVAQVLAYVFQLRTFHKEGGAYPVKPENIAIPTGLDPLEANVGNPLANSQAEAIA